MVIGIPLMQPFTVVSCRFGIRFELNNQVLGGFWPRSPTAQNLKLIVQLNDFGHASAAVGEEGIDQLRVFIAKNNTGFEGTLRSIRDRLNYGGDLCRITAPEFTDHQPIPLIFSIKFVFLLWLISFWRRKKSA